MIYQNIKAIAKSQNVSITNIEKECDITPRYICTWDRVKPRVDTIARVANYLGTTVDELIKE